MGIDLGTSNTLVYVKDQGVVIHEPSIAAINIRTDQILAVGHEAKQMLGKTPSYIETVSPLVDGVISDFEVGEKMLKYFIDKIHQEHFTIIPRPRVIIGIPLDITEVEKKAVEDAALSAGASEVLLIEGIMAGAIGARLPIKDASASMIVDLGGGLTEIAIISLGGVVTSRSIRIAGTELNKNIIQYVRDHFNLLIGDSTAEMIKIKIGSVKETDKPSEMKVRGRDLVNGLPRQITVNNTQIREAIDRSIKSILENIKSTLEITPPELVSDIYEKGMTLVGGGALLNGIDKIIAEVTQIPVYVADDPLTCAVRGAGAVLEDMDSFREIIVPSASMEIK